MSQLSADPKERDAKDVAHRSFDAMVARRLREFREATRETRTTERRKPNA